MHHQGTMKPVVLITYAVTAVLSTRCPFPWKEYNSDCYLFHSGEKTFKDAEKYCNGTSKIGCREASLVSVKDYNEFLFIRDLVYARSLNPLAFFMGGYTTAECPSGAWTDGSSYPICTGDEHDNTDNCSTRCENMDECTIEKCMVANLENWLQSIEGIEGDGNFTAIVADYNCSTTELPFVCKAKDVQN